MQIPPQRPPIGALVARIGGSLVDALSAVRRRRGVDRSRAEPRNADRDAGADAQGGDPPAVRLQGRLQGGGGAGGPRRRLPRPRGAAEHQVRLPRPPRPRRGAQRLHPGDLRQEEGRRAGRRADGHRQGITPSVLRRAILLCLFRGLGHEIIHPWRRGVNIDGVLG